MLIVCDIIVNVKQAINTNTLLTPSSVLQIVDFEQYLQLAKDLLAGIELNNSADSVIDTTDLRQAILQCELIQEKTNDGTNKY